MLGYINLILVRNFLFSKPEGKKNIYLDGKHGLPKNFFGHDSSKIADVVTAFETI